MSMSKYANKADMIRSKLLSAGVKNLKEFGYPGVNAENILTDQIYRAFFKSMLEDNMGKGMDEHVGALLKEVSSPLPQHSQGKP